MLSTLIFERGSTSVKKALAHFLKIASEFEKLLVKLCEIIMEYLKIFTLYLIFILIVKCIRHTLIVEKKLRNFSQSCLINKFSQNIRFKCV